MGKYFFNKDAVIFFFCVDMGKGYNKEQANKVVNYVLKREPEKIKKRKGFDSYYNNIDSKLFDWVVAFDFNDPTPQKKLISFMIGELEDKTLIPYYKKHGGLFYDVKKDSPQKLWNILKKCYKLVDN